LLLCKWSCPVIGRYCLILFVEGLLLASCLFGRSGDGFSKLGLLLLLGLGLLFLFTTTYIGISNTNLQQRQKKCYYFLQLIYPCMDHAQNQELPIRYTKICLKLFKILKCRFRLAYNPFTFCMIYVCSGNYDANFVHLNC
jgi:hypothetical protein